MGRTALELSPQEWKQYDPASAILARKAQTKEALRRHRKALQTAREAAQLLRREFGAQRVVLFGSLTTKGFFTPWSDIDLAAWGIPAESYYRAVDAVVGLSGEFKIDLVDVDSLRPSLLETIEREGVEL